MKQQIFLESDLIYRVTWVAPMDGLFYNHLESQSLNADYLQEQLEGAGRLLAWVMVPGQCHIIIQLRPMKKGEGVLVFSEKLKMIFGLAFFFETERRFSARWITPKFVSFPSHGVERSFMLRDQLKFIHDVPVALGYAADEFDWPLSSAQYVGNPKWQHPLGDWWKNENAILMINDRSVSQ
ncbi:MAG: hypothetical protein RLY35_1673 [Bacteroidota bacterium]|jgi:hypothetical protein